MNYTYIHPEYLSNAETDIKTFFENMETTINYNDFKELIAVNPEHEKQIIKQFKYISMEYTNIVTKINEEIKELRNEIVKKDMKIDNMQKLYRGEINKNRYKNRNMLLSKNLKIEKMKMNILKLKNNKKTKPIINVDTDVEMTTFINNNFIITNNDRDKIYKYDFVDMYNSYYDTNYSWEELISDVKLFLTYNKYKKPNGGNKGVIIGIKKKPIKQNLNKYDNLQMIIDKYYDHDINGFVYHKDLYNLYINTCPYISKKKFTSIMLQKGYRRKKQNGRGFLGLVLKPCIDDNI